MVSFSPGWNLAPPTGLKYCCNYMLNFSRGAKRKFPWEILLMSENTVDAHAGIPFSARDEKIIAITWIFHQVISGSKTNKLKKNSDDDNNNFITIERSSFQSCSQEKSREDGRCFGSLVLGWFSNLYHMRGKITECWLGETEGIVSQPQRHFW